ncbi:MAG: hypothetical protein A2X83_06280 [Desulfuromonadales bacterium GWD2_54_10]|nr:MAG: hypothetical protein A2X83_06280 [Desulfuromonadales bacterium GWD2_54_10]
MGRRGGLAGMIAAIAGATIDAAFRASRRAEAERKRQIRAAESERKRQIRAEENEKIKVGKSAKRLADKVNEALKIARRTPNQKTKLRKIYAAQHIIEQLKNMEEMYSYLTLYDLLPIEAELMQMQAETESNLQNLKT